MDPAHQRIAAATRFCDLGMWNAAVAELEPLSAGDHAVEAMRVHLRIQIAKQKWHAAASTAEFLIAYGEEPPATWIQGALAIRRSRSLEDAHRFLSRGEGALCEDATFHYALATLECQLGNLAEAGVRLSRALQLNPELRPVALEDPDLDALWQGTRIRLESSTSARATFVPEES